ncbi:MAG: DNA internalization-related competence protein ComEC/Rec2 [Deltaproteobacteria bacterium]|nr:DNA internalization-related competence protein ComEC/Rec2 [Deltaproteobacteria bacterium]
MRLVWWTGALIFGMATALLAEPRVDMVVWLCLAPLCGATVLVRRNRGLWAEGIMACCIGLYVGARAQEPPRLDPPIAAAVNDDRKVRVQGWVVASPEPLMPRPGCRLRVAIRSVDGISAAATAVLVVAAGVPELLPGDTIQFEARLRAVRGLANPGVPDSTVQARANGIHVFAGVGAAAAIRRVPDGPNGPNSSSVRSQVSSWPRRGFTLLVRAATRSRLALGQAIDRTASGSAAGFLHTAVLGERRNTDPLVEDGFRAAGATHVLSVSGLHLAAVGVIFFVGTRRALMAVPRLPLWVEPRATAAVVAIPAIVFYTLITGSAIATVRSALMMVFGLIGVFIGRRNTPVVAVAAAVLVLLAWSPLVLADISFQLSAVSVMALAVLVRRLGPAPDAAVAKASASAAGSASGADSLGGAARWWDWDAPWLARPFSWLGGFAAATVAAGVTTAPIVAHYFGEVTPAAPLGNLVLVPLVELVVVPFGLLGAVVGAIAGKTCSLPLLTVAEAAAWLALRCAEYFRQHAPVWLTRSPKVFETAARCIGATCLLAAVRRRDAFRSWGLTLGAVLVVAAAGSLGGRDLARRLNRDLVVTFLDVGQGDAAVLQIPGGATVLIDGGGTYDGSFDPGARVIEPFLRARGITSLDVVALSHPHPDHLGGLHRVVARFAVDHLWTSGDDGRNPEYVRLVAAARGRGVSTPVPATWEKGGVTLQPLGPFVVEGHRGAIERIGVPEGTTVNDASLVIRASYGKRGVLFTGDIEENGEGELAGRTSLGQAVASDVLKVPHHGSRTSSTPELLEAVRPQLAVISLGWRNRFHFPRPEVVERFRARDIRLLRTDLHGAVTLTVSPDGNLSATCERGCR